MSGPGPVTVVSQGPSVTRLLSPAEEYLRWLTLQIYEPREKLMREYADAKGAEGNQRIVDLIDHRFKVRYETLVKAQECLEVARDEAAKAVAAIVGLDLPPFIAEAKQRQEDSQI